MIDYSPQVFYSYNMGDGTKAFKVNQGSSQKGLSILIATTLYFWKPI